MVTYAATVAGVLILGVLWYQDFFSSDPGRETEMDEDDELPDGSKDPWRKSYLI